MSRHGKCFSKSCEINCRNLVTDTFFIPKDTFVRDALASASSLFESSGLHFGHGTDNAWDESVVLLFWAMGISEDPGESVLSEKLDSAAAEKFSEAVRRRAIEKLPAAYITGEAWFCGLRFFVNQQVLVPRSPIAELIQNAYHPWLKERPGKILDLCCGSGCIGIAAAIFEPNSEVVLADFSAEALEVAKKNVDRFELSERATVVHGDLFEALGNEKFDLILCNPPYVDSEDIRSMPAEYAHEPEIGLGSGADGLHITRKIISRASDYLHDEGVLILEVGNSWVNLERAFPSFPFLWVEFANGGHGVCVLSRAELQSNVFRLDTI